MKSLIIISKFFPEYSGPGVRCLKTYNELKNKKIIYDFLVVCGSTEFKFFKKYNLNNIHITRLSLKFNIKFNYNKIKNIFFRLNYFLEYTLALLYFLFSRSNRFDYFHVYGNNAITNASLSYAKIFSVPVIIEVVTSKNNFKIIEPLIFELLFKKFILKKYKIICISNYIFNNLKKKIPIENLIYKPNPISKDFNFQIFEQMDKKYLLCLGKIMPGKNQIFLLDLLNILPEYFHLIIAGPIVNSGIYFDRDTNYLKKIKQKVIDYNLSKRVEIISKFIKEPINLYKKCHIGLFPFLDEGLGTPVLETIACGRNVLINNPNQNFQELNNFKNFYNEELKIEKWKKIILDMSYDSELLRDNSLKIKQIINFDKDVNQYKKIIKSFQKI